MASESFTATVLSAVEDELQRQISHLDTSSTQAFHEMLAYHMGWHGEGAGSKATGKRIRPLLVCLTYNAISPSSDFKNALPAGVAIELIHNFSLVHDDIQDQSPLRRGRPTVWKNWGIAQAINVGDALFILAHQALLALRENFSADQVLTVSQLTQEACLNLTCGQYLDLLYENHSELSIEQYWPMIACKTAALLSACTHIGAVLGNANEPCREAYRDYGHFLGMAFQVYDDYLGIWGDSALTGKSTESDLVSRKKSLPVLFGLNKRGKFARRWKKTPIQPEDTTVMADLLTETGANLYTLEMVDQFTDQALQALRQADPQGEAGEGLYALTQRLIRRQS